ncbi:hypothetical protein BJV78DRAFT_608331 [Lactifluus subvellereus]|nr:hypothetical protein BJV78DRAFT_608331 [Lactifluus subvellereus]
MHSPSRRRVERPVQARHQSFAMVLGTDFLVPPVHPKESELEGIETVPSLTDLPAPAETSVSIITKPKVTLDLLYQAKELNIPRSAGGCNLGQRTTL